LPLLVPLGCEQTGIRYCHSRLSGYEHDDLEIMRVVGVGLVREDLHYSDGTVVISERCRDLALHFAPGGYLEDRSLPPLLWL
jgi:hypothetical protein